MEIPVSSCFNLLKTIENRGYLYAVKPRGGVYPTKRILELARVIAANDPIASRVSPVLQALRDESGETIVFAKRRATHVVYLRSEERREGKVGVRTCRFRWWP